MSKGRGAAGRGNLELAIFNECPGYPAPRRQLAAVLAEAWRRRGIGAASLSLLLVDDRQMRRLNRRFKGRGSSTDVLAFSDGEPDPTTGQVNLGDIAVSVLTARRQARARGLRVCDEVTLYALHGLLHLIGMRDDTPAGRRAMEQAQAEEFARHGLRVEPVD